MLKFTFNALIQQQYDVSYSYSQAYQWLITISDLDSTIIVRSTIKALVLYN